VTTLSSQGAGLDVPVVIPIAITLTNYSKNTGFEYGLGVTVGTANRSLSFSPQPLTASGNHTSVVQEVESS